MFRFKQFAVRQDRCPMKVGTDGVLLGAWAEVRPGDRRMLDVGTGTGLIALAEHLGVKNATLMWPVRIAAAGKLVTPGGAVEICHLLGKDETLRRLRLGLDKLN